MITASLDDQLRDMFDELVFRGHPRNEYGPLGNLASAFHLGFASWDEIVHDGEHISLFNELEETIFPFDVFEVIFPDAIDMTFYDANMYGVPMPRLYRPLAYLLALRHEADKITFTIMDKLEMYNDDTKSRTDLMVSAGQFTLIPAKNDSSDGEILFAPILPSNLPQTQKMMDRLAFEEDTKRYWLRLLMAMIRFARMLNHRGVTVQRFADPLRPPTRQQRRAAGYVDRDHYRIVLRPRLSFNQAIQDALSGRSTRYTPRRRHPVQEFTRTYSSGKTGPVRAHVRGGRLAPGVDYDARAVILAAITNE